VDAHNDDVGDFSPFEEIPDFNAAIADSILVADFNQVILLSPRRTFFALRLTIAAAVGMVDWITGLFLSLILPVTPIGYIGRQVGGSRGSRSELTSRVIFVIADCLGGGVDNQNAFASCYGDNFVYSGG
jgi:hypothetical protein